MPASKMELLRIEKDEERVSFVLPTRDSGQAKALELALLDQPTYAVDQVIFYHHQTPRHDELLAHRIGLLVVQYSQLRELVDKDDSYQLFVDFIGPRTIYARDLGPMFVHGAAKIVELGSTDRLTAELIFRRSTGAEHSKWFPILVPRFVPHVEGFQFAFELTGALSLDELVAPALARASEDQPWTGTTLFTVPQTTPLVLK